MYFYYYFEHLDNDHLNLHTNSYNISVKQQQFSPVSLGCLWSEVTESLSGRYLPSHKTNRFGELPRASFCELQFYYKLNEYIPAFEA